MTLGFLRQNLKAFIGLIVFIFICSFVGRLTNHDDIAGFLIAIALCSWFGWSIWYYLRLRRILFAFNSGQFKETIALCEQLIPRYPLDSSLYVTASAAYLSLSKPIKAAELADKAVSLDPRNVRAYNNRAMARVQMNQFDEALTDCNSALDASDKLATQIKAHLMAARATVHAQLGNMDKALEDCTKALAIDPKSLAALLLRAHCYCVTKQFQESLRDLDAVMTLSPSVAVQGVAFCNRARVHLSMGDLNAAFDEANKAIKSYPDAPPLLSTRGLIYARNQKFDEALVDLSAAIEIDPFYSEAYWFRREVYESLGQTDKAQADEAIARKYCYQPYL